VAGSFAEEAGDPAAGASGAMPVSATGMSMAGTRTPAVVGAEAPFGEPCPAPGPPQPAFAAAVVEDGTWGGSWGASGVPAGAPPEYVVGAAVAVAAGSSEPPVAGAAGEGEDAVGAVTGRLWLADPAACAAVRPAGRQPLLPAGAITAPPGRTGAEVAVAAGAGAGAGAGDAATGAVVAVGVFATVVVGAAVPSALAVVAVAVVVVWVVVWVVVAPVTPLVVPVVLPVACDESVVVVVVVVVDGGVGSPGVVELVTGAWPAAGCSARGGADLSVAAGSAAVGSLAGVCSACVAVVVVSSACAATSPAMARPAYSPAPRKTAATVRDSHDRPTAESSPPSPPVVLAMGRTLGTVWSRHQPLCPLNSLCGVSQPVTRSGDCGE
jgi:hypothetical protein